MSRFNWKAGLVLVAAIMTGCADNAVTRSVKRVIPAEGVKLGDGATLEVTRRLYLSDRPEATWIQKGYPIDVSRVDEFDARCQFEFNFKGLDAANVDSTRIEPDVFQVLRRSIRDEVVQLEHRTVASTSLQLSESVRLVDWVTVFVIRSEKHPWVRSLRCLSANNSDSHLSDKEINATVEPSLKFRLTP